MIVIWADGSCPENPGPGGWAFVCVNGEEVVAEISGGEPEATNNTMELTAVIEAIYFMEREFTFVQKFRVVSDSQYVVNGVNKWMANWKRRKWRKKGGIKNLELWKVLDQIVDPNRMEFVWVKGHDGITHNERADALAGIAAEAAKTGKVVL